MPRLLSHSRRKRERERERVVLFSYRRPCNNQKAVTRKTETTKWGCRTTCCDIFTPPIRLNGVVLNIAMDMFYTINNKFGLGPLACSDSEFDFWNLWIDFWTFGRTPWMGDQTIARLLPTQDSTAQKNADTHPCLERDSNPWSQCSSGLRPYVPQTAQPLGPWICFKGMILS
jgi:hypothetical protein